MVNVSVAHDASVIVVHVVFVVCNGGAGDFTRRAAVVDFHIVGDRDEGAGACPHFGNLHIHQMHIMDFGRIVGAAANVAEKPAVQHVVLLHIADTVRPAVILSVELCVNLADRHPIVIGGAFHLDVLGLLEFGPFPTCRDNGPLVVERCRRVDAVAQYSQVLNARHLQCLGGCWRISAETDGLGGPFVDGDKRVHANDVAADRGVVSR